MRKYNNCIVFVFVIVFIIVGFLGKTIPNTTNFFYKKYTEINSGGVKGKITALWNVLHENNDEKLFYYDKLLEANSIKENILGTRVVYKDVPLVKTDSGKLHRIDDDPLTEADMQWSTEQIKKLQEVSEASGAKFLYCGIPSKGYHESMPDNVNDFSKENYDAFLESLDRQSVPYIDFFSELLKKGVREADIYFNSDHHWQIHSSFIAYQSLCEQLNNRYGFDYNYEYADLNNYSVTHYPKIFLGSWGQKLGAFFSWLGRDDFDVIIPNFNIEFVESQPFKNETRKGSFEETVLNNYNGELKKNGVDSSLYDVYGGNFRLQIIQNGVVKNGKKVLMVRDSFAQPVSCFFATQVEEVHLCDVRSYMQYVGEKINMESYISEIKPDYVIVLYSGAYSKEHSSGYYDFF